MRYNRGAERGERPEICGFSANGLPRKIGRPHTDKNAASRRLNGSSIQQLFLTVPAAHHARRVSRRMTFWRRFRPLARLARAGFAWRTACQVKSAPPCLPHFKSLPCRCCPPRFAAAPCLPRLYAASCLPRLYAASCLPHFKSLPCLSCLVSGSCPDAARKVRPFCCGLGSGFCVREVKVFCSGRKFSKKCRRAAGDMVY